MFVITRYFRTVFILYVAIAILPALFLMSYIDKHDTHDKEPAGLLWSLFFLGAASTIVAMILENIFEGWIMPSFEIRSAKTLAIVTATSVGLIEEGVKFYFMKKRTWHDYNFNYRYDGVVYAVFVSLGFAAIENILYVFNFGLSVAGPRALLAVPAHMGFAVFMGAFYGRAKICSVQQDYSGTRWNLLASYIVAVLLHSIYDATAMIQTPKATGFFVAFVVIMYIVVFNKIKKESSQDRSIY